jgi:hypothetical protein
MRHLVRLRHSSTAPAAQYGTRRSEQDAADESPLSEPLRRNFDRDIGPRHLQRLPQSTDGAHQSVHGAGSGSATVHASSRAGYRSALLSWRSTTGNARRLTCTYFNGCGITDDANFTDCDECHKHGAEVERFARIQQRTCRFCADR